MKNLKKILISPMVTIGLVSLFQGCSYHQNLQESAIYNTQDPKTLDEIKKYIVGTWESIAIELRPGEDRMGYGKVTPTYLKRTFTYAQDGTFHGTITLFLDNYGTTPLATFDFDGSILYGNAHKIAQGAFEMDYILDKDFSITPLNDMFTQMLNQNSNEKKFTTGQKQSIFKKEFSLFNIKENQIVKDYDLIYFTNGMLFMGAKHVDGMPFDKPERRPHQLQIPLKKIQ